MAHDTHQAEAIRPEEEAPQHQGARLAFPEGVPEGSAQAPVTLYHAAPISAREHNLTHGLRPIVPDSHHVHLWTTPDAAKDYARNAEGSDIYEVSVPAERVLDPAGPPFPGGLGEHKRVEGQIPPEQVRLVATKNPGTVAEPTAWEHHASNEPWFPDRQDAVEANQQALAWHGQTNHALLRPDVLDGALGRAQNYWHYEQDLPKAAAALMHGIGQSQAFEDGNKRTAFELGRIFLDQNGLGHVSSLDQDDDELADHLIGYGEGTHQMEDTANLFRQRMGQRQSNILDPIHDGLDPRVWSDPLAIAPTIRPEHSSFIYETIFTALDKNGYDGMENWLSVVFTGSLTTYQYSDDSDVDTSLFVDTEVFPDWSRAEMIGIMISACDGTTLPGTPFPLQCFVVPPNVTKEDLYKPGMRSGYDLATDTWIVPPDRNRVHDVEKEMNAAYTIALENADKMEKLLRYEPDKAVLFWHQIHKRRMRDQNKGKGDYSPSNITYKMLANRGLFPQISDVSGEHIARKTQLDLSGLV